MLSKEVEKKHYGIWSRTPSTLKMIKDKITEELKKRFIQEIESTIRDGKERGFIICKDKRGKLTATKSFEGKEDIINMGELVSGCKHKVQGDFHTHTQVALTRKLLRKKNKDITFEEAKNILLKSFKNNNIEITNPSHGDLLSTLGLKFTKETLGTTCIASDAEPDRVECWTIKNKITKKMMKKVNKEITTPIVNYPPQEWTIPLFHREIINLK